MDIKVLNPADHPDYDQHEIVVQCQDAATSLNAMIAIHNSNLGPALGGCRMYAYTDEQAALTDVLRLSKGMTYKSALAGLPLGGGKAVIIGDPNTDKSPELMHAMGRFVESLQGKYITAEDSGTDVGDIQRMNQETSHVAGVLDRKLADGTIANGDPSPATAYGVYTGIKAALAHRFGSADLTNVKVAVQGIGNVGRNLVKLLVNDDAKVIVADNYQPTIDQLKNSDLASQIEFAPVDEIHALAVDVYSPCALGGALNTNTLVGLQAPIVAGAANNQLADEGAGQYLFHKGTVYAPDFVINAGGIIDIFYEREGYDPVKVKQHIESIGQTLTEIFEYAKANQVPTHLTAERLGRARFENTDLQSLEIGDVA